MRRNIYFGQRCLTLRTGFAYRLLCQLLRQVDAAGGLVVNGRGECLLIRRNGLWDLPKGHREPGEDIADTAAREVCEETGVQNLQMIRLVCRTDHSYRYRRGGVRYLKHTFWYEFRSDFDGPLCPQTEEGIVEAVWVPRERIAECLKNSYPCIREVFAGSILATNSEQQSIIR